MVELNAPPISYVIGKLRFAGSRTVNPVDFLFSSLNGIVRDRQVIGRQLARPQGQLEFHPKQAFPTPKCNTVFRGCDVFIGW